MAAEKSVECSESVSIRRLTHSEHGESRDRIFNYCVKGGDAACSEV